MQAMGYMLGLLLGLIAVGVAAPAVMMMNGAINGYAHTTRMNVPSEHMDHHAAPIVHEGTCCGDQNRTMDRTRDQLRDHDNRSYVDYTGAVSSVDPSGYIVLKVDGNEITVKVCGLWQDENGDTISYTTLLNSISVGSTVSVSGYTSLEHGFIRATSITIDGSTYTLIVHHH